MSANGDRFQNWNQLFKLCVVLVVVPSLDVNSILFLPAEVLLEVVDYYGAFYRTAQTSEIFDIVSLTRKVILKMDCMLTVETMCD